MLASNEQILFTLNWFKKRQRQKIWEPNDGSLTYDNNVSEALQSLNLFDKLESKYKK